MGREPKPATKIHPNPGDLIEVQWEPTRLRQALFLRFTRTGTAVIRLDKVEPGALGVYHQTGEFSSTPRTIEGYCITRIIQTADDRAAAVQRTADLNAERQREREAHGGETPAERAMRLADEELSK